MILGVSSVHFTWEENFELIQKMNFHLLEIFSSFSSFIELPSVLKKAQEKGIILSYHPILHYKKKEIREGKEAIELVKTLVQRTKRLGGKYLILHPHNILFKEGKSEGSIPSLKDMRKFLVEIVKECISFLEKNEISLYLENVPLKGADGIPLGQKIDDFLYIFSRIEKGKLGICLDFGHANIEGELENFLSNEVIDLISYVHLHDNNGKTDEHLLPGKGNIDWKYALSKLLGRKFRGTIVYEFDIPSRDFDAERFFKLLIK